MKASYLVLILVFHMTLSQNAISLEDYPGVPKMAANEKTGKEYIRLRVEDQALGTVITRDDRLVFSEKRSDVSYPVKLDASNFVSTVKDELWLTLFDASACHDSQNFVPTWKVFSHSATLKTAWVDW